jgi:peptidyl-prolyl cis-trans isomerase SurA
MTLHVAAQRAVPVDAYAALVNDRLITVNEVFAAIQPIERELRMRFSGEQLRQRLEEQYDRALDVLIERAMILEEFEKMEGAIPPQFIDDHINDIIADQFDNDRQAFVRAMHQDGLSMEEFRETIRDRLIIMLQRRNSVGMHVAIPPRVIRDAYESRIEEYTQPPQVHVRMITLLRPEQEENETTDEEALERATRIAEEARQGESFERLAQLHSEDARAVKGGDWGWIEPTILRAEIQSVLEAMNAGDTSGVIDTPEAFYIVHVEGRKPAQVTPFNDVREELENELRQAEEERLYEQWMTRLRHEFYVERFPPPLST